MGGEDRELCGEDGSALEIVLKAGEVGALSGAEYARLVRCADGSDIVYGALAVVFGGAS